MSGLKTYTHTIFKNKDLAKYLTNEQAKNEMEISYAIKQGRAADGKNPENQYYICNVDEPYADKVLQVILNGEDEKAGIAPQPLTLEELMQKDGQPVYTHNGWGVVGKRDWNTDSVENRQTRLTIGFPYGWEWAGDVMRCGPVYDRQPAK